MKRLLTASRDLRYVFAVLVLVATNHVYAEESGCTASARLLRFACASDHRDDFHARTAQCQDNTIFDGACVEAVQDEFDEGEKECGEILEARLDICETLDDATHEPPFGPLFAANSGHCAIPSAAPI